MPFTAYHAVVKPLWLQTPRQLADQLRSLRKARGLTQAALGELVGLDQTRIAKIEHDPGVVSLQQLMRLLSVLDVRVLLQPVEANNRKTTSENPPSDW